MPVSFAAFYQRWADQAGWTVPDIHLMACDWLEHGRKGRVGVLKGFRGLSKSTIVGRYVADKIRRDQQWRFLAMSATDLDAAKLSTDAQFVIQQHPWCGHLRPKKGHWQVHRFAVDKAEDVRNPNVAAYGILSNITGGRADEAIFDDVEVPKTIRTPALRENLRLRMSETTHILVPGGKKLYVGTDHCVESIYKEQIERGADLLEIPLFLREATHKTKGRLKDYVFAFRIQKKGEIYAAMGLNRPRLLDESEYEVIGVREKEGIIRLKRAPLDGERLTIYAGNQWESRFSRSEISFRMTECLTWGEWDSQYQLRPAQLGQVRLDPDRMIPYRGEPEIRRVNGETTCWLNGVRMVGVSTYWDCSLGKKESDTSAFVIIFADSSGCYYWHRAVGLTGEIDEQCQRVVKLVKEFSLPSVRVETNGPGGFVPAILRKHLKMAGLDCAVESRWVKTNKNIRILDALEPPLSGMFLHASEQVLASPVPQEMRNWDPKVQDQPDDYEDAAAGAISETPVRIGKNLPVVEPAADRWTPGGGIYTAAVDY